MRLASRVTEMEKALAMCGDKPHPAPYYLPPEVVEAAERLLNGVSPLLIPEEIREEAATMAEAARILADLRREGWTWVNALDL